MNQIIDDVFPNATYSGSVKLSKKLNSKALFSSYVLNIAKSEAAEANLLNDDGEGYVMKFVDVRNQSIIIRRKTFDFERIAARANRIMTAYQFYKLRYEEEEKNWIESQDERWKQLHLYETEDGKTEFRHRKGEPWYVPSSHVLSLKQNFVAVVESFNYEELSEIYALFLLGKKEEIESSGIMNRQEKERFPEFWMDAARRNRFETEKVMRETLLGASFGRIRGNFVRAGEVCGLRINSDHIRAHEEMFGHYELPAPEEKDREESRCPAVG